MNYNEVSGQDVLPRIGMQTKNVIVDTNPLDGFGKLKAAGFSCVDFSLNSYLLNTEPTGFFCSSLEELKDFFTPHKKAAEETGIKIWQMHMPYALYIPQAKDDVNRYLWYEVASKSMELCAFLDCPYIVVHGFKLARQLGSEEAEWDKTKEFLDYLAPIAMRLGITICIENLYAMIGNHIVEGPCCDVHKVTERIDAINAEYGAEVLGFCFDTGHANLVGLDMESFITSLGSRLKVLHVHDNDGVRDLHQIPFTFTRTKTNKPATDWSGFVSGLQNINFEGVLSFETAPVLSSFPEEMKEETLAFIASVGRYFAGQLKK